MEKKLLFYSLLVFVFGFNSLEAQSGAAVGAKLPPNSSGYVAINTGLNFAAGDFANQDIGGATGVNTFQLSGFVPFKDSRFGLGGKINYSTYLHSNQPFFVQQNVLAEAYGLGPTVTSYVEKGDYEMKQITFLAGPYLTFPLGDLSIDLRALFGPTRFYRPAIEILLTSTDSTTTGSNFSQGASVGTSIASNFGIGIRYNLLESKKLCMMVNFDYGFTQSNFLISSNAMYIDDLDYLREGSHSERINYTISYYDITVGLGYVW